MADSIKIKITGDSSEFERTLSGIGKNAGSIFKGMMGAQIVTKGISLLTSGLKSAIQTGMQFESAMSQVAAISGATGQELELLTETAKHYGETTMFSASQAAEALNYMALAGWDAQQSVDALGGVLDLAAASGMDLGRASDAVTDYLSAFGMEANQAGYMADLMAYAQSNANTSASQLSDAYGNCASSMHAAGQDIETTTAMLMALANQGIKGSEAGTQMTAVMRDLTQKMDNGQIMIGKTAVKVTDASGNFRDLNDIIMDVGKATEGLGTAEQSAALMTTFTARSVKAIQTILNEGVQNVNAYEDALRGSEGTAAQQASIMMDNLQGDIKIFQSALEGLQITASESTNGIARSLVQEATGILEAVNKAGKTGGLNGMADALIGQIPSLLPKLTKGVQGLLSGLGKQLPGLMKNLIATVPDVLGSMSDLVPSLIEALTDAAAAAIEGLVANLPNIIPTLIAGAGKAMLGFGKGLTNVAASVLEGVGEALQNMGVLDRGLSGTIQKAIDNIDTSKIHPKDVKLPSIGVDGEVDPQAYIDKVNAAKEQIDTAIAGLNLSDADAEALKQAILKGSGAEALKVAFTSLGASEADAQAAVDAITAAKEAINGVFAEFSIDDDGQAAILAFAAEGLTLRTALMLYGGMDAESAASAVESVKSTVADKLAELGLDETTIQKIQNHIANGGTLQSALEQYAGLTPEQASAKVEEIQSGVVANLEALGVPSGMAAKIAAFYLTGSTLEGALSILAGLNESEATAALEAIDSNLDAAMQKLGVPPGVRAKIQAYVRNGGSLEDALKKYTDIEPTSEEAQEVIGNMQSNIASALEEIGVPAGVAASIAEYVVTGAGLSFAMSYMGGINSADAESTINGIHNGMNAALLALGVDPAVIPLIQEYVDRGGELSDALSQYTNLSPDEAATAIDEVQQGITDSLVKLGVPEGVASKIAGFMVAGMGLQYALGYLESVDGDEAKEAAETLQTNLDSIAKVYQNLNLAESGISLSEFYNACQSANGQIAAALKLLGMTDPEIEAAMASVETLANSISARLEAAFEKLKKAFTNGKASDDAEAAAEAMGELEEATEKGSEKINTWLEEYTAQLAQMELSAEEYKAAVEEAEATAAAMQAEMDATIQQAKDWVSENAGKSTKEVEAHLSELDGILNTIENLEGRIEALRTALSPEAYVTRNAVVNGYTGDESMQAEAIELTFKERQAAIEQAKKDYLDAMAGAESDYQQASQDYSKAILDADKQLQEDLASGEISEEDAYAKYDEAVAAAEQALAEAGQRLKEASDEFERERKAAEQAADETFNNWMQKILTGMVSSDADLSGALDGVLSDLSNRKLAGDIKQALIEGAFNADGTAMSLDEFKESLGITPEMWSSLAESIGQDVESMDQALSQALAAGDAGGSQLSTLMQSIFGDDLSNFALGYEDALNKAIQDLANQDGPMADLASVLQYSLEQGWLEGMEGVDLSGGDVTLADLLQTALQDYINSGLSGDLDTPTVETPVTVEPEIEVEGEAEEAGESVSEGVATGIESTEGQATDSATTLGDDTIDALDNAVAHHSPSAKAQEAGASIPEGLTAGITGGQGEAIAAASALGDAVIGALNDSVQGESGETNVDVSVKIGAVKLAPGEDLSSRLSEAIPETAEATTTATITMDSSGIDSSGMSSAASGAVKAAISAANAAAAGANSVGSQISAGIASGISSGRSAVISAAAAVARAAIQAAKAALAIRSPSKITQEFGRFFDEGLALGIDKNTSQVVRSAVEMVNRTVGAVNLRPQLDLSGVASTMDGAISNFAEIEGNRELVFNVNGREMARASRNDYYTSLNNYGKRLKLGKGRGR